MNGFLYFISGLQDQNSSVKNIEQIKARGLGYALDDELNLTVRGVNSAVEGQSGLLFGMTGAGLDSSEVRVKGQAFKKIPGADRCWVMYTPAALPKAEHLLRSKTLNGHFVEMINGDEYLVPVARGWTMLDNQLTGYNNLPQTLGVNDDGELIQNGVLPQYQDLWELACAYFDVVFEPDENEVRHEGDDGVEIISEAFTFKQLFEGAVRALRENYRIGVAECDVLGLMDQHTPAEIMKALIDFPTITKLAEKKTDAGLLNTGSGNAA